MTNTEIPLAIAKPILSPASNHPNIVMIAIVITVGTKIPDTLSAILAIQLEQRAQLSQEVETKAAESHPPPPTPEAGRTCSRSSIQAWKRCVWLGCQMEEDAV